MKAIFISYNQAFNEDIVQILERHGQRGFTRWEDVAGRGGSTGEPHYGNHAWPVMNHAVLTFVADEKAGAILDSLKEADEATPDLGLRAFSWKVEDFR